MARPAEDPLANRLRRRLPVGLTYGLTRWKNVLLGMFFYELCKQNFPDIGDQTIAKMVSGIDVILFRPDDELKRLAARAIELGVAAAVRAAGDEDALRASLSGQ